MTATYRNRDKDNIQFHDDGTGQIWMTGYLEVGVRCGLGEDNETIKFVDPSGGPMISVGDNLKSYYKDNIDRIIGEIEVCGVVKMWYKINEDK